MNESSRARAPLNLHSCLVALIDHQPFMTRGMAGARRRLLVRNVLGLAAAAGALQVPVVLTAFEANGVSRLWPRLLRLFPGQRPVARNRVNVWADDAFVAAVRRTGRAKLVLASLADAGERQDAQWMSARRS